MSSDNGFCISISVTVIFFYYSIILLNPNGLFGDPDTLWHIRTGQWILDHARVPTVDHYSYTATGERWISTEWLAEIFFALAFRIGEWRGVVILSSLTCAAIIAIICFYLVRNLRFSVAIGWTALTATAISFHFLARPHIFAYIVALLWIITLLESYDRGDFKSSIPLLCILMVLWANLHPSFTFGLGLLYVFIGYSCYNKLRTSSYRHCKYEFVTVIAVTACALLTPYGIFSALLTFQTMTMKYVMHNIVEWQSPNFQQNRINLFFIVGFLMTVTGLGVRLRGPRLIAYGMVLSLGLSYSRGLAIFYLLTPVLFARPLSESSNGYLAAQRRDVKLSEGAASLAKASSIDEVLVYLHKRSLMLPAIFLAAAIFATATLWRQIGVGPPNSVAPEAALDFVRKAGITGNVFNDYYFGGYLIFKGIPTFVDGRTPPFTEEFLREYSNAVSLSDRKSALQLLDRYNVQWVLLVPTEPLARALAESDQWNGAYSDKDSVVFVRSR
jgi:hypothetical protein